MVQLPRGHSFSMSEYEGHRTFGISNIIKPSDEGGNVGGASLISFHIASRISFYLAFALSFSSSPLFLFPCDDDGGGVVCSTGRINVLW